MAHRIGFGFFGLSILIGVFFFPCRSSAQSDTVMLDLFLVKGGLRNELRDFSNQSVDSVQLFLTRSGSLADLLSQSSPVTMRYYGPGQLASAGFRGASASQTVVVWNGIRINNPMMMQTDLATLPVQLVSEATLAFGSGTLQHASGAFGGVVNLTTAQTFPEKPELSMNLIAGSFGYFSKSASLAFKTGPIQSQTTIYQECAENNFPYPDNFAGSTPYPVEKRINAGYDQRGIMQHFLLGGNKGWKYQTTLWYQENHREIPYPILQPQGKYVQTQSDDDLRIMFLASSGIRKSAKMEVHAGYQEGRMHFRDERSVTDAMHQVRNLQQGVKIFGRINGWSWLSLAEYELQQVISDAYQGALLRHIAASYGEIIRDKGNRLTYGLSARIEVVSGFTLSGMPALIAGYKLGNSRAHFARIMLMRNRQLPGLNDLYWIPGGNPELMPEKGPAIEVGYERKPLAAGSFLFTPRIVMYYQRTEDKIRWLPDSTALWSAVNIGQVRMKGLESFLKVSVNWQQTHFEGLARIQVTSASRLPEERGDVPKQLVYQPFFAASFILMAETPFVVVAIENTFTGKQYTNTDNTAWLPAYTLTNCKILSQNFEKRHFTLQGSFNLYNLFDRHYQAIAWYPMPGRSFRAGINIKLKP
ncbi:MAG: TonB-dependent receptor [Bacteroidales bacterium]